MSLVRIIPRSRWGLRAKVDACHELKELEREARRQGYRGRMVVRPETVPEWMRRRGWRP